MLLFGCGRHKRGTSTTKTKLILYLIFRASITVSMLNKPMKMILTATAAFTLLQTTCLLFLLLLYRSCYCRKYGRKLKNKSIWNVFLTQRRCGAGVSAKAQKKCGCSFYDYSSDRRIFGGRN